MIVELIWKRPFDNSLRQHGLGGQSGTWWRVSVSNRLTREAIQLP